MNYQFLFTFLICLVSFQAKAQSDDALAIDQVMKEYFKILKQEGYAPAYDTDNDIEFKMEGDWYYVIRPDYDDGFSIFTFLAHEDGCDTKTLMAANYASRVTRYAKAYLTEDCSRVMIKSNLYNGGSNVEEMMREAMLAVKYCGDQFLDKYNN